MTFQSAIKDEEFTQEHGISQLQALVLIGAVVAESTKTQSNHSNKSVTAIFDTPPKPPKESSSLAAELNLKGQKIK